VDGEVNGDGMTEWMAMLWRWICLVYVNMVGVSHFFAGWWVTWLGLVQGYCLNWMEVGCFFYCGWLWDDGMNGGNVGYAISLYVFC
jgi:hypothetical protein